MRILVVGSGAREHALAWKLRQSPSTGDLHAAPGNPGIAQVATVHDVGAGDLEGVTELARRIRADLVVVGPEAPLVDGLAGRLEAAGIAAFGPAWSAARLEGSKSFAKSVMDAAGVPTASFALCDTLSAARATIAETDGRVVVKADGLAAGKGVFVCDSVAEAERAVRACLVERRFGESGSRVIIEQRLTGPEVSVLALVDGERVVALPPARDAKRALDADRGPNTGGMGAIAPTPDVDADLLEEILATVHRPVTNELARRGAVFRGCLYAGIMLTPDGLRVLEFNVRFGDPEAQAILPLMDGDLARALHLTATGSLEQLELGTTGEVAVAVALAASGYPDAPETGAAIDGIHAAEAVEGVTVFHAGTALVDGRLVAAGGRVLTVTAVAADFAAARERAYEGIDRITMAGGHHRTDIGAAAASLEGQRV